jgi:hypothetical protein
MLVEPAGMRVAFFDGPISALGAALALTLSLGGCSHPQTSLTMEARAETWAPAQGGTYLAVGDKPPLREQEPMTVDEQTKLKNELTGARLRQDAAVKARDGSITGGTRD